MSKSVGALKSNAILGGLVLLTAILCGIYIQEGHPWGDDFALYLQQTRYMIKGIPLQDLFDWNKYSMQHSNYEIGPYLYPNGFPLLLAPAYAILGLNFVGLKTFCALFFVLAIPLTHRLFKARFNNYWISFMAVALVALNPYLIRFSDNILSDLPFLCLCLLSFYLMKSGPNKWNQLLLGACIFYAYFTRDVGIFLVPALFVYQYKYRKAFKNQLLLAGLPYLVFGFLFIISKLLLPNGGENHLEMLISKLSLNLMRKNWDYYMFWFSELFAFDLSHYYLGLFVFFICVLGVIRGKTWHFFTWAIFNFFILLIWPSTQGERFLFPILPFLVYYFIHGLLFIFEKSRVPEKMHSYLLLAYLGVFVINSGFNLYQNYAPSNAAYTQEMKGIYTYLENEIPSNEIVAFKKPRALWFFSGTKSIYREPAQFDASVAPYLLILKDPNLKTSKYTLKKDFGGYVLLQKRLDN